MTIIYLGRIMLANVDDETGEDILHGAVRIEVDGSIARIALGDDTVLCDDLVTAIDQLRRLIRQRGNERNERPPLAG